MKRIGYFGLAVIACSLGFAAVASAQTPNPNGAYIHMGFFNDCPVSNQSNTNGYPALIHIEDNDPYAFAGTNKHLWKFSEDGGASQAAFQNASNYSFCADVQVGGDCPDDLEGGLNISPWWSDGDGQFMANPNNGEIAVFGGRLPFCSNHASGTVAFPQPNYVNGQVLHMAMQYIAGPVDPTNSSIPAQVTYYTVNGGTPYQFGPVAFDQGNTAENPPHGLWGELTPASVGGYFQLHHTSAGPTTGFVNWSNICYTNLQPTPTKTSTWGSIKALYR
jgi:hypothetical protein